MVDVDVDALSIKEMRALIAKAGLRHDDCLDKADLRQRTREAIVAMPQPSTGSANTTSASEVTQTKAFGTYSCIVKGPSDLIDGAANDAAPADLLVIGLHGLGASNTDLAEMPSMLRACSEPLSSARIVEVYPQAPSGGMVSNTPLGLLTFSRARASYVTAPPPPFMWTHASFAAVCSFAGGGLVVV